VPIGHIKINLKFLLSIGNLEFYIENCLDRGYHLGGDPLSGLGSRLGGRFRSRLLSCFGGCFGDWLGDCFGDSLGSDFGGKLGSWFGSGLGGSPLSNLGSSLMGYQVVKKWIFDELIFFLITSDIKFTPTIVTNITSLVLEP